MLCFNLNGAARVSKRSRYKRQRRQVPRALTVMPHVRRWPLSPQLALFQLAHYAAQDALAPIAEGAVGGEVRPGGAALGGVRAFRARILQTRGDLIVEPTFQVPVQRIHAGQVFVEGSRPP